MAEIREARERVLRAALATTFVFNLVAAFAFAFPSSLLGRVAGLPENVPRPYAMMSAFFVLLFAGAYFWLLRRPTIDRNFLAFSAIGKTGVFIIVVLLWLAGDLPSRAVLMGAGDLGFAAIFCWWLSVTKRSVA